MQNIISDVDNFRKMVEEVSSRTFLFDYFFSAKYLKTEK